MNRLPLSSLYTSSCMIQTGDTLPEGYQVGAQLGTGGYAVVYAGYDPHLERDVAIKVFNQPSHHQAAQRFYDEGRLLARLSHPHIIQIFALGHIPNSCTYLVMEKFGQGSLAQQFPLGVTPPLELTVMIIFQVLHALHQAHQSGIVHRDIKAANLLFDAQNQWVKLCDFGVARSRYPLENQAETTCEGHIVGTTHYIAPERFQGINNDMRSDLYSVGVLFYRLLVGKRPFELYAKESITPEMLLYRIFHQSIEGLEQVPSRLAHVCLSLLVKTPSQRSQSAQQALHALQNAWYIHTYYNHSPPISVPLISLDQLTDTLVDESAPEFWIPQDLIYSSLKGPTNQKNEITDRKENQSDLVNVAKYTLCHTYTQNLKLQYFKMIKPNPYMPYIMILVGMLMTITLWLLMNQKLIFSATHPSSTTHPTSATHPPSSHSIAQQN